MRNHNTTEEITVGGRKCRSGEMSSRRNSKNCAVGQVSSDESILGGSALGEVSNRETVL